MSIEDNKVNISVLLKAMADADDFTGSVSRGIERDVEGLTEYGFVKINIQLCERRKLVQRVEIELEYLEGTLGEDAHLPSALEDCIRWNGVEGVKLSVTDADEPEDASEG